MEYNDTNLMSDLKKILTVFLALALLATVLTLFFNLSNATRKPELTLTYLYQTNDSAGIAVALFAVTNIGNATAVNLNFGILHLQKEGKLGSLVRCTQQELLPGKGDVVQVRIRFAGNRWRYECCYARKGIKSWICNLEQNHPKLSSRLPSFLKVAIPTDVTVTSDWIDTKNKNLRPQKTKVFEI